MTLDHLSRQWVRTPVCFTPNAVSYDQRDRGLIDIELRKGRFWLRLTPAGEARRKTNFPFCRDRAAGKRSHPWRNEHMTTNATSKPVLVRTYSAGVHFGHLKSREGKEVTLEKSRRIWRWYGANTLNEIATKGLDVNRSRVAEPVSIVLTEAIEIIDCTPEAVANIESAKWAA